MIRSDSAAYKIARCFEIQHIDLIGATLIASPGGRHAGDNASSDCLPACRCTAVLGRFIAETRAATIWRGAPLVPGARKRAAVGYRRARYRRYSLPGMIATRLPDGSRSPPRRSRTHTCTRRARAHACERGPCLSVSLSLALAPSIARPSRANFPRVRARNNTAISATRCDTFTASRARSSSSMSDGRRRSSHIDHARRFHGTLVHRTRGNSERTRTHGRDSHLHSLLSPWDGFLRALHQHAGKSDVAQDGSGRLTGTRGEGKGRQPTVRMSSLSPFHEQPSYRWPIGVSGDRSFLPQDVLWMFDLDRRILTEHFQSEAPSLNLSRVSAFEKLSRGR